MYIINNYDCLAKAVKINFCRKKEEKETENIKLKRDFKEKCSLYPDDIPYLCILAEELGLKEDEKYKLKSIIGQNQLEDIIKNAERKNFNQHDIVTKGKKYTKSDLEALAEKGFYLNLHMHSQYSDGQMSIQSMLDKAAEYADIVREKSGNNSSTPSFVIAITDHDTMEGAKEAVKIISKNPAKYKNLGVVLGAELSTLYRNEEMLAEPFAYELVAYSVNPFDKQFNDFLAITRKSRIQFSKQIIHEANIKYPDMKYTYAEACESAVNPKKGIDGFLYTLAEYFENKAKSAGKEVDKYELSLKYLPTNEGNLPNTVNNTEDLFTYIKNGFGFLGTAHPAKIYLGDGRIKQSFIDKCNAENKDAGQSVMSGFFKYLKTIGGSKFNAVETNYQSYEGDLKAANDILNEDKDCPENKKGTVKWIEQFRKYAEEFNLLETGGLDTHSENPFVKK